MNDEHPCLHGHAWWYGECQDCGATHDEDCPGCADMVDPHHEPQEAEEDDEPDDMRAEQAVRW